MVKKLKNKLKNKKGIGSLEIVISALIVIMMVAGLIDMIQITQRLDTTSQATGYVARVVQKQGGVQPHEIDNFSGKYVPTSVLYGNVRDMMDVNGIPEEDWTLKLTAGGNTYTINEGTALPLVDYGHRIKVTIETKFKWHILSSMMPGDLGSGSSSSREVLSGYQVRDGGGMNTDLEL